MLVERAPAKINLFLHVLGRRADGYHELESLVAFAGVSDTLSLAPGGALSLSVAGPTGAAAGALDDNLVIKAARALATNVPGLEVGSFHLVKRLPVAAGIGGGSSDAAAALRLLARANGLPLDDERLHDVARSIGADVSVCLSPRARMMRGIGESLGPPLNLPPLFSVLVNPGVAVETRVVFERLGLRKGAVGAPEKRRASAFNIADNVIASLTDARNDLEAPATLIAPGIAEVLVALRSSANCRLARMSGSGATCFGIFLDCHAAAAAARRLRMARSDWWIRPTLLR